jgi:hypothetical protein
MRQRGDRTNRNRDAREAESFEFHRPLQGYDFSAAGVYGRNLP